VRVLLAELRDNEAFRFTGVYGRFSRPVLPGEKLTVSAWRRDGYAAFQVRDQSGAVVIDRGQFFYHH
jgi:acyl dehydratase